MLKQIRIIEQTTQQVKLYSPYKHREFLRDIAVVMFGNSSSVNKNKGGINGSCISIFHNSNTSDNRNNNISL
jgi:hypothetical protein